jgi:hypothetical protein
MPWEDFLLPTEPSPKVRQFQNNQNLNGHFNGKYIGIIPLVWNPLAFYKKSNGSTFLEDQLNNMDIMDSDIQDKSIKVITTCKETFIVQSVFYYLLKKKEKYYPVFKYDDSLPFTINHLKDSFSTWLTEIGYVEAHFIPIRIYKMKGFHVFALILDNQIPNDKLNTDWGFYAGLPLLHLKDQEITNSMMKVSQNHYNQKETLNVSYASSLGSGIWEESIHGYAIEEDLIFPFHINFEQIIATLSNQIDSNSNKHKNFYFKPNLNKRSLDVDFLSLHQNAKKIKL